MQQKFSVTKKLREWWGRGGTDSVFVNFSTSMQEASPSYLNVSDTIYATVLLSE